MNISIPERNRIGWWADGARKNRQKSYKIPIWIHIVERMYANAESVPLQRTNCWRIANSNELCADENASNVCAIVHCIPRRHKWIFTEHAIDVWTKFSRIKCGDVDWVAWMREYVNVKSGHLFHCLPSSRYVLKSDKLHKEFWGIRRIWIILIFQFCTNTEDLNYVVTIRLLFDVNPLPKRLSIFVVSHQKFHN